MAGVFAGLSAVTGSGSNNNETTTTASSAAPWPLRAPAVTTAQPHTPPVVLFGAAGANASTFASAFGSSNSSSSGHSSSATTSAPTRPALFATSPAMTTTPSAPPPPLFGNTAAVRSTPFSFATPRATTTAAAISKPPATMTTPAATPFTSSASVFGAPSAFAALTTATTAPFAFGARNNNNNSNISAAHTPSTSNTSVSQSLSTTSTFGIRPQRDDGVLASNNSNNNNSAIVATMRKAPRRDDEDSHDAQQRGRASHGAFVARAVSAANTPQQATSSLRRPTTTTTAAAAAATAPQLAAAASLSPRVAVPESTAQMCLLARVVDSFYRKLAAPSAAVREQAGHEVSLALCGVAGRVGVYADVTRTAAELHAVWTRARAQHHSSDDNSSSNSSSSRAGLQRCRGDVWVVVFTLGAQINLMVHAAQEHNTTSSSDNNNKSTGSSTTATYSDAQLAAYKAAVHTHRRAALADACALANELSTLLLDVYSHDDDTRAPFSALAPVLRCVQAAFDAAAAAGVTRVQSNLKAVTSKLFSVLYKRVKGHVVRQAGASSSSSHETWVLRTNNDSHDDEAAAVVTRALLCAFATLVSVMMRVEAPSNDDVDRFVDAFHRSLRDAYAERCVLYECRANVLLQHPLTMERVAQAAELFARAIVTSRLATTAATTATSGQRDVGDGGEGGERARRRLLHMKLTATQLALGRIPSSSSSSSSTKKDSNDGDADDDDDDGGGAVLPRELADVAVALRAANLTLFDAGMRHNAVFFVQAGLYNVLQLARVRVSLLMVVKAYMARGCDNRLLVSDLVALHALPYDEEEAALVWLLPLLVDKHINGVLDGGALILSDANPFDDYPKATLRAAAAAEYA